MAPMTTIACTRAPVTGRPTAGLPDEAEALALALTLVLADGDVDFEVLGDGLADVDALADADALGHGFGLYVSLCTTGFDGRRQTG
jgi:hypothetical protein